jgi:hypothetical protein
MISDKIFMVLDLNQGFFPHEVLFYGQILKKEGKLCFVFNVRKQPKTKDVP